MSSSKETVDLDNTFKDSWVVVFGFVSRSSRQANRLFRYLGSLLPPAGSEIDPIMLSVEKDSRRGGPVQLTVTNLAKLTMQEAFGSGLDSVRTAFQDHSQPPIMFAHMISQWDRQMQRRFMGEQLGELGYYDVTEQAIEQLAHRPTE